jgi:formate hydrogenlyase subunit 3/multisubunit Na+/H+ antiporter MnhD subunit
MAFELITHPMLLPVTIPLLAALVCLIMPNAAAALRSAVAVLGAALTLIAAWPLFNGGPLSYEPVSWISLRVDALSAFVLLAVAFFGLLIAVFSVGYMKGRREHREYFTYYLWTLGASCAVVLANDLLLLLVCWGFLGLLLYLMVGIAGAKAAGAARKSLMIIGASDALLLFGIVLFWQLTGSTRIGGIGTGGAGLEFTGPAVYAAFACFVAGAFAKAGAVPFHSWVPDFGEKADAPVSAYLPASLDKLLGIYLLARCVTDLFAPTTGLYVALMAVGAVTILSAVLMALVQHDLKRLLSYHAVSQVGYMVLGIGTGTPVGLAGGLFHMLNNTIYKSALFLCAGAVEKQTGSTDLDRLGGLARVMPLTFVACTTAALAISGVPPLNGFASKWMIYQGVISSGETGGMSWVIWLAVAMLGSALTLASFVKVLHATFLCKPSPEVRALDIRENRLSMGIPLLVLAALCALFGVFAFQLPLGRLIFPAVSVEMQGVWWAGLATLLILASIAVGLVVYALTLRGGRLRRVRTYIGGENIESVYVSGEAAGPGRHVEVTGVDFYKTIEQLPAMRRYYRLTRARAFDVYHLFHEAANYFIGGLRAMHTGILPAYLRWFVVGMVVVVWVVTQAGS